MKLGEELSRGLIHYRHWVLLYFMRIEFQNEERRSFGNNVLVGNRIPEEILLKITCSSMIVFGMTVGLMKKLLSDLLQEELLAINKSEENSNPYYFLTANGNLYILKYYGRLLNYNDLTDPGLEINNNKFLSLKDKILHYIKKNESTSYIKIRIISEFLMDILFVDIIKEIFDK